MQPIEFAFPLTLGIVLGVLLAWLTRRRDPFEPVAEQYRKSFDQAGTEWRESSNATRTHLGEIADEAMKILREREASFSAERHELLTAVLRSRAPEPIQSRRNVPMVQVQGNGDEFQPGKATGLPYGVPPRATDIDAEKLNGKPLSKTIEAGSV